MSNNKFTTFTEMLYSYNKVPLMCLQKNKIIFSYPKKSSLIPLINKLYNLNAPSKDISFNYHFDNIFIGRIKVLSKNSNIELVIGPVLKYNTNLSDLENMIKSLNLDLDMSSKIIDELLLLNTSGYNEFINLMIFLNYAINGKAITEIDLIENFTSNQIEEMKKHKISPSKNNDIFTEKIKKFISQGDQLGFSMFSNFYPNKEFKFDNIQENIENYKNHIIFYLARISDYAVDSGVDYRSINRINSTFMKELENVYDFKEAENIFNNALKKYFDSVNSLKITNEYHSIVKLAIIYINENIESHLLVSNIAKKLNVSRSYLSKCFVEDTSITIQDYIINEKLNYGAMLLKTTNQTVVEISKLLTFSNQSHFQNSFKKHFGITPLQYRKNNQKIK